MTHHPRNSLRARVSPDRGATRGPEPVEEPRIPATMLIAEARRRGEEDARKHVRDGWSFTDPFSAEQDADAGKEDFVNVLRQRCKAAVASARDRHLSVLQRIAPLRGQREQARCRMEAAERMMTLLAGREAWSREPDPDRPPAIDDGQPVDPVPTDDPVWEGETTALGLPWRAIILAGLVATLSPVHFLVFSHFLSGVLPSVATWGLGLASAMLMVLGPHVTAVMLRAGRATGSDRALKPAAVVLAFAWSTMAVVLGLVAAAIVGVDHVGPATTNITGTTLVAVFIAGLVVGGSVAFMIGLARRHPIQEAYAASKRDFEELDAELQAMIARLDPGFADFDVVAPDNGGRQPETLIEAIQAAYRAAEYAYFDALSATMGDPAFTEAVEHRLDLVRRAEIA